MAEIKIVMLGTGTPRPNLKQFPSSQLLFVDGLPILIDCGAAATYQLLKFGLHPNQVKYLWFTHLHSDHTLGYGQFLIGGYMTGRQNLTVVGPQGTKNSMKTS